MDRPFYERAEDIDREGALANKLVDAWRVKRGIWRQRKLPRAYCLDRVLEDREGRVVGFAEIKIRDYVFGTGDGYWLSLHKVAEVRALCEVAGLPAYFVAEFRGGEAYWIDFRYMPRRVVIGGRTDRGDSQDIEPMIATPWDLFQPLVPHVRSA